MTIKDLFRMSISNLIRRKLRTFLTILGVIIGTASIVVMLSLGLGLKKSSMEQIEQSGGLTTITVFPNDNQTDESGKPRDIVRLDDKIIEQIKKIPGVKLVSPVLQIEVLAKYGGYEANLTINGMTEQGLQNMGLDIERGNLPEPKGSLQLFWGNLVANNFHRVKGGNSDDIEIDPMKDTIFYIFDTETYYSAQNNNSNEPQQSVRPPKKYILPVCGVLSGGNKNYSNHSYDIFAEVNLLTEQVKKIFKNRVIPGQPTQKNGKPFKTLYYNNLYVRAEGVRSVEKIQDAIRKLGLVPQSNIEWLKQVQQQMGNIQMVLGGIGAVSLLVAAIGIANTMMMSIYERTKEIGIFKVLGCELSDIKKIFLIEAASIGLIGGISGLILSYFISFAINFLSAQSANGTVSYIPFWLLLLAVVFSTLVGMIAGFLPALRAMKLSPLAALRNE